MDPAIETLSVMALWIIGIFSVIGILVCMAERIYDFKRELRYIKGEIDRSDGAQQRYWKRKKRQLWLSLLPFFRK